MSLKILSYDEPGFHLESVKMLFRRYQDHLDINLDFQNFEEELSGLPGKFASPKGNLYLALWNDEPVGCTAFYAMSPEICELKRLFVLPEQQGRKIGKSLLQRAMSDAQQSGYQRMRLDSLQRMESAGRLYQTHGFYLIDPYNENPYPDVYYMECHLTGQAADAEQPLHTV